MQQRKIIIFLITLFVLSSAYLSFVSQNLNDPDYQKNWWAIYFSDPKSESLDFIIENHSDKADFHYVILLDNQKIKEADVKIEKGSQAKLNSAQADSGKVTIQVSAGEEKKEIYKNFDK